MQPLIKPKPVQIDGINFIISKIPYDEGREIFTQYATSAAPKIGDYALNNELKNKMLSFVEVVTSAGTNIRLTTKELINNHVTSDYPFETGLKLEKEMLVYNCSFLQPERISAFFANIAQNVPAWITKILTDSLQQLSQRNAPPSTN